MILKLHWSLYFNSVNEMRRQAFKIAHKLKKKLKISLSEALKKAWRQIKDMLAIKKNDYKYIIKAQSMYGKIEYLGFNDYLSLFINMKKYFYTQYDMGYLPDWYTPKMIDLWFSYGDVEEWVFTSASRIMKILKEKRLFKVGSNDDFYFKIIKIN